ncbi:hypothetical protein L484_002032 [Morus notabilis]|uniref:Secreted protein n=1 Tax=Morus notabilis TaxID=981085 RepID=W9RJX8_9ROSA|nr:hypothetical protein L484_002032 [Morus notabilis]
MLWVGNLCSSLLHFRCLRSSSCPSVSQSWSTPAVPGIHGFSGRGESRWHFFFGLFHEKKRGGIVVCSTFVALVYIPEYSYGREALSYLFSNPLLLETRTKKKRSATASDAPHHCGRRGLAHQPTLARGGRSATI